MKKMSFLLGLVVTGNLLMAQPKPTDLDKSPMDISYYPSNYPIAKMRGQEISYPLARIIYSRPQKKDREIFGQEVKYNEVWRFGANEATELELFKTATFGWKSIPKGRYTLYCIPAEKKWTIVVNKDDYNWGSFNYKSDNDVARIDVPVQKSEEVTEALTMYFEKDNLSILWDNLKVAVPVRF